MQLVSIIMPAYNMLHHISHSVHSVLNQTYPHWELIIVNDGSSDQTLSVIEAFSKQDARIKVLDQPNQGVSTARNNGLKRAKGTYITFLDGDDLFDPFYLEKTVDCIQKNDSDMVFCKYKRMMGETCIAKSPEEIRALDNGFFHYYIHNEPFAYMTFTFKHSFLQKTNIRFNPECSLGEDTEFILSLACSGKVGFVPEYLYHYTYREDSACSGDISVKKRVEDIDSKARLILFIRQNCHSDSKVPLLAYLSRKKDNLTRSLERKIWQKIKNNQAEQALAELQNFKQNFTFNQGERLNRKIETYIINTRNIKLWQTTASIFSYLRKLTR